MSTSSIRSGIKGGALTMLNQTKKEGPKPIKEEPHIKIVQVEAHNIFEFDSQVESLRKEKELEKKQRLIQLKKLKEIQEDEEAQKKQMQKLQQDMKTKPFV